MKTVLFGFAGSGKTELFHALAGPGAGGVNRAMVKVPEPRLEPLVELFQPRKKTYAEIEYVDLPGGGGKGSGLSQKVQSDIRTGDCLLAVLDGFSGFHSPEDQYLDIETEFLISDETVADKRLERLALDRKKGKHLVDPGEEEALERAKALLEKEKPLRTDPELAEHPLLRGFRFLSAKPVLFVWNHAEEEPPPSLPEPGPSQSHLALSAKLERELAEIEDPEEKEVLLRDFGLEASALETIIARTYAMLGLITFLTVGEKEVRAWTLRRGSTAFEAAGAVHSDIQRGFIRAEVLSWSDFERCKRFKTAKDKGLLRLEGKEYIVQDGDIITFRFNI